MKEQITKYLCERNENFLQYHTGNANSMVNEVQEFFESGRFITSEVCDFLVSVIVEVFNLTIHVYQRKTDGKIQVHSFSAENPEKEVHLKLTHNNTAPGGNHYDCVARTSLAKKEVLLDQQKSTPIREEMRIPEILKRSQNLEDEKLLILLKKSIQQEIALGNPLLDLKMHQQLRRVSAFQPTCTVKWNLQKLTGYPEK